MYTILIADDNISFAKLLVNDILATKPYLKVSKIATEGKEALDLMISNPTDIVLLDLVMTDLNGWEILEKLPESLKKHYKSSVIVITGCPEFNLNIINNPSISSLVASYISKGSIKNEKILEEIDKVIINKKNSLIYKKITEELKYLGYNLNHNGTTYLAQAIYEIYLRGENYNGNLKQEIYPKLAKCFHTSTNNIKCSIIKATKYMTNYCTPSILEIFFGGEKPTPKIVIDIVYSQITKNSLL